MQTLADFMLRELPIGSCDTGRTRHWWSRICNDGYVYCGAGDLNPDQANQLIEQFCRTAGWTVLASPVRQRPRSPRDLTEQHAVLCAAGYYCVRCERMSLAYGAIGDTAASIWQLIAT